VRSSQLTRIRLILHPMEDHSKPGHGKSHFRTRQPEPLRAGRSAVFALAQFMACFLPKKNR
jgi:hypothetical protein